MEKQRYVLTEACELTGVKKEFVTHCIHARWIIPADATEFALDEEDLARLRLIHELKADFGVNDEAIPIILGLLDQLYALRAALAEGADRYGAGASVKHGT
ncbi:MAG: chaperone modulator CbpM [Oligoflexia bacterium]|nr:chaperone modulator CbpM [Oligoflexia bacterium]